MKRGPKPQHDEGKMEKQIGVRLPPSVRVKLEKEAGKKFMKLSTLCRQILAEHATKGE